LFEYRILKRLFDVTLACIGTFLLSPVLIFVALAVKLDSPGPVFYRGMRAGFQGKPFFMLKFRTMVANAERLGGFSTSLDDPRITRVGKWLRKYKLDELPQLFNVIVGQMSFVGPRPEVLSETANYSSEERALLSVVPGISDWASLRFANEGEILKGSPDPHEAYRLLIRPEKIRLGLRYVRERSFFVDVKIITQTLTRVAFSHVAFGLESESEKPNERISSAT